MFKNLQNFKAHALDNRDSLYCGALPEQLVPNAEAFATVWELHPEHYYQIKMHGRLVNTPRWQQAYGADYFYSGAVNLALPVPELLLPIVTWSRTTVDDRLNGVLLNWYDGSLGHYIGRHRDSTRHMVDGAPIVTISLGETRTFRLRPWKESGCIDFPATNGTVFVMPYQTNLNWTHEIPRSSKSQGRRVSITLRALSGIAVGHA